MKNVLRALWAQIAESALAVGLVLFSTTAIAQPFYVPTGSMEPTIAIGDALIGTKFPYGWSRWSLPGGFGPSSDTRLMQKLPRRGDVVVFRLPRDPSVTYVKRVIGLPGDRIQMRAGRLFINGVEAKLEPAGAGKMEDGSGELHPAMRLIETLPGGVRHPILKLRWDGVYDDTKVFVVPKNHLFMMGDNRDDSLDSRVAPEDGGVGFVPMENLMAKAEITIGSYDWVNAHGPASWPGLVRLERFFKPI